MEEAGKRGRAEGGERTGTNEKRWGSEREYHGHKPWKQPPQDCGLRLQHSCRRTRTPASRFAKRPMFEAGKDHKDRSDTC